MSEEIRADKVRDFIGKGRPSGEQQGKGTQEKSSASWLRAKLLQSFLTLCYLWTSPPGSSVHGTLQARILEWVAMPFSRVDSRIIGSNGINIVSCMLSHFSHV